MVVVVTGNRLHLGKPWGVGKEWEWVEEVQAGLEREILVEEDMQEVKGL